MSSEIWYNYSSVGDLKLQVDVNFRSRSNLCYKLQDFRSVWRSHDFLWDSSRGDKHAWPECEGATGGLECRRVDSGYSAKMLWDHISFISHTQRDLSISRSSPWPYPQPYGSKSKVAIFEGAVSNDWWSAWKCPRRSSHRSRCGGLLYTMANSFEFFTIRFH